MFLDDPRCSLRSSVTFISDGILLSESKGELKERLPVVNCCVAMAIVRGQIYVFVVTYFVGARYRATIQLNRLILGGTKAVHCIKLQL